jgi:hypothetical protein
MKYCLAVCSTLLVVGCSSTRILERDLDASAIPEVNRICEDGCSASVSYLPDDEVGLDLDTDSLYSRLRLKDLVVTLSDTRVLSGRLGRVGEDNDRWVLWQRDEQGNQTDTVQFRASAAKRIFLSGTGVSERLSLDESMAYLGD